MSQDKSPTVLPWERRNYDRLQKTITLHYRRFEDLAATGAGQAGKILDIGGGGLCFLAPERLSHASQQLMIISFPGWREEGGDWHATGNESDIALLTMIGTVLDSKASVEHPERFEIRVCFSGRLYPETGQTSEEEK